MAVMSHLLSFLEQYSHFQQLQQQADQYRVQLKRHRVQHRRQMKALRASYRQRLRDKSSIISDLEDAISQQQSPSPLSEGEDRGKTGCGRVTLRCKRDGGGRGVVLITGKIGWCEKRDRKVLRGRFYDVRPEIG